MKFTIAKIAYTFFILALTCLIGKTCVSQDSDSDQIEIATSKHGAEFPSFIVPLRQGSTQETRSIKSATKMVDQQSVITASANEKETKASSEPSEEKPSNTLDALKAAGNSRLASTTDLDNGADEKSHENVPTNSLRVSQSESSSIILGDAQAPSDNDETSTVDKDHDAASEIERPETTEESVSSLSNQPETSVEESNSDVTFQLGSNDDAPQKKSATEQTPDNESTTNGKSNDDTNVPTDETDVDNDRTGDDHAPSPYDVTIDETDEAHPEETSRTGSGLTQQKLTNLDQPSTDIADDPVAYKRQEAPPLMEIRSTQLAEQKQSGEDLARIAELSKTELKSPISDKTSRKLPDVYDETDSFEPFDRSELQLRARIRACIAYYMTHLETVEKRSPWAVMHAMLPYGVDAELTASGRPVNAIGWMLFNGRCRTQRLFSLNRNGSFNVASGPGVQGHEGQLLAMLAQSFVSPTYPISVNGRKFTVRDLVKYEMANCRENSELTFQLIGISHYMPSTTRWRAKDGRVWDVPKLIREELKQPIIGAACGGNHRLFALTYAVKRRQQEGLPIDGEYRRAAIFIDDFLKYAWTLQNPDGSFSTNWYSGRGNKPDHARKVQTTGHIVEWMVFTLPADQLRHPRMQKSIRYLLSQVLDKRQQDWAIGPRGHANRALALYDEKVFGSEPGKRKDQLANEIRHMRRVR